MQVDDVDRRIIASLSADARTSYADIGILVSLSAPAVKRRVDRLRATGVIKGFTVVLDPASIGWSTEAFVELFC
ncbi:MAG: AsnC family transcriptional regulator, partial [Micromonosporaceae bacterium]|nr:AsnC family transcriptional regulator [Micromonosporaceae bacterium]